MRLQQYIEKPGETKLTSVESRSIITLIVIVSLLVEHYDFDKLRTEEPSTEIDLNSISTTSITEHVYNSLLQLHQRYHEPAFRARVMHCLGFLFCAQPTLMTLDQSAAIMDEIFASDDQDGKARLLKIIQDFLTSEAIKHSQKEKGLSLVHFTFNLQTYCISESAKGRGAKPVEVNMEELVGNTEGFADSG